MSKPIRHLCLFVAAAAVLALSTCQKKSPVAKADLALLNGNIITVSMDLSSAQAVAIRGGVIIKVGTDDEVRPLIGEETKVIDLGQKLAIPGFIDAHIHAFGVGSALTMRALDLRGLTKEQILEKVAQRAKTVEKGVWISGRGWDQAYWKVKTFPTRYDLDAVAPDNPVGLSPVYGHSGWYNSTALRISHIDKNTRDPDGGRILRDARGEPTGMLIEKAQRLIVRSRDAERPGDKESNFRLAMEQFKKWGLTGIQDAGADRGSLEVYEKLSQNGELTVRVYAMVSAGSDAFEETLSRGPRVDNFFTVRAVKMLIDGALGPRGALLFEPYSDSPETSGLQMMTDAEAYSIIDKSLKKGFQVCSHAIGDKAVRLMLDLYQRALKENQVRDPRLRIEHSSVIQPEDVHRFRELNVIPSMQPVFLGEYGRWSEARLGTERLNNVLPLRRLLDAGAIIAGGTDYTSSDSGDPLINFYAAVTRKSPYGVPKALNERERVTRDEALRMLTLDAAYAAYEENIKGSIQAGKLADLVVLSKDIMKIDEEEILKTEVSMTILNGKIIYQK